MASVGEPDARVLRDGVGTFDFGPDMPAVPPWSLLDARIYDQIETLDVAPLSVLSHVTHSPFGDVRFWTRYEQGRPSQRELVDDARAGQLATEADIVAVRRLSCVLLHRADVVDLLGSLRGGEIHGDWSRLMLLAGVVESPDFAAAQPLDDHRHTLIALALFCEAWAHGVLR